MLALERDEFFAVAAKYPAISKNVILELATRLRDEVERKKRERTSDALQRLCATLLDLADRQDSDGKPVITLRQHELAERIGTARETVSRCLKTLKDMGAVRMQGRDIVLVKAGVLRRYAETE